MNRLDVTELQERWTHQLDRLIREARATLELWETIEANGRGIYGFANDLALQYLESINKLAFTRVE